MTRLYLLWNDLAQQYACLVPTRKGWKSAAPNPQGASFIEADPNHCAPMTPVEVSREYHTFFLEVLYASMEGRPVRQRCACLASKPLWRHVTLHSIYGSEKWTCGANLRGLPGSMFCLPYRGFHAGLSS